MLLNIHCCGGGLAGWLDGWLAASERNALAPSIFLFFFYYTFDDV